MPYSPAMTDTAKRLRRAMTPAERRFWELVRDRRCGHRFLRQAPAGQYVLDFYCASVRLAVEIDGSVHDLPEVKEHDANRDEALQEDLKMTVLHLTNQEVLNGSDEALRARIVAAIESASQKAPPWESRPTRRR